MGAKLASMGEGERHIPGVDMLRVNANICRFCVSCIHLTHQLSACVSSQGGDEMAFYVYTPIHIFPIHTKGNSDTSLVGHA